MNKKFFLLLSFTFLLTVGVFAQNNKKQNVGEMVKLTSSSYNSEVSKGLVIVDYWAPWCGPCRKLAPVLDDIVAEKKVKVGKLNVDENKSLAVANKVSTIPTMFIYKDGKLVERLTGVYSKNELLSILKKYE